MKLGIALFKLQHARSLRSILNAIPCDASFPTNSLIEHNIRHLILQPVPFWQPFRLKVTHQGIVEMPPASSRSVPRETCVMATRECRADVPHHGIRVVRIRRRHGLVRLELLRTEIASDRL